MAEACYTCDRCLADLKNKTAFDRHKARKKQCEPVAERLDEAKAKAKFSNTASREMFKVRHMLRAAGVTGFDALESVMAVIFLRELEQIFGKEELTAKGNFKCEKGQMGSARIRPVLERKETLFSTIKGYKFMEAEPYDFVILIQDAISILASHKGDIGAVARQFDYSGKLFPLGVGTPNGNTSRIAHELVQYCADHLKFNLGENDVFKDTFTEVLADFADKQGGLGQFFTDLRVINYAVEAVRRDDRALGTVLDPTCGSGGFLAAAQGADEVHGCEIDSKVFLIAHLHCLLAHKKMAKITRCDFLLEAPFQQFDTILANPPFGVKGRSHKDLLEAKEMLDGEGMESFPLKSSITGIFWQRIIRMLKVGGRAAIVLPLGKEIAGKSAAEAKLRRAILKACRILEIVNIPSGMFENTGIRTVLIIFEKMMELSSALDVKEGKRKTVNIVDDLDYATEEIKFSAMQLDGSVAEPQGCRAVVTMDDVKSTSFSLSPDDYKTAEEPVPNAIGESCPMLPLRDVCELKPGKSITKSSLTEGAFPVVGGGVKPMGSHNQNNTEANSIIISATGSCGFVGRYDVPVFRTSDALELRLTNETVDKSYIYYLLSKAYQPELRSMRTGMAQPHFNKTEFLEMKVPVPSLAVQQDIVRELDELAAGAESAKRTAEYYEKKMKMLIYFATRGVPRLRFGDLCVVKAGAYHTKSKNMCGAIPVYGGGDVAYYTDAPNRENKVVIAKDGVSRECVRIIRGKFFLNHHGWTIEIADRAKLIEPFVNYLLLSMQGQIYDLASGAAQKGINQAKIYEMLIPVPSLDVQRELAGKLDEISDILRVLKNEHEDVLAMMRQKLHCALSLAGAADSDGMVEVDDELADLFESPML